MNTNRGISRFAIPLQPPAGVGAFRLMGAVGAVGGFSFDLCPRSGRLIRLCVGGMAGRSMTVFLGAGSRRPLPDPLRREQGVPSLLEGFWGLDRTVARGRYQLTAELFSHLFLRVLTILTMERL